MLFLSPDLSSLLSVHPVLSSRNRHLWTKACKAVDPTFLSSLKRIHPQVEHVVALWLVHGVEHVKNPIQVDDLMTTPGRWFYTDLLLHGPAQVAEFDDPKVAYHGTSMASARAIIKTGKLLNGVSVTGEKIGVYCEREERKSSVMTYASHMIGESGLLAAAVLELCVDRSRGTTIHNQWVQSGDSILITGVYTHLLSLSALYNKGYLGWYNIHQSAFTQAEELGNSDYWNADELD